MGRQSIASMKELTERIAKLESSMHKMEMKLLDAENSGESRADSITDEE